VAARNLIFLLITGSLSVPQQGNLQIPMKSCQLYLLALIKGEKPLHFPVQKDILLKYVKRL